MRCSIFFLQNNVCKDKKHKFAIQCIWVDFNPLINNNYYHYYCKDDVVDHLMNHSFEPCFRKVSLKAAFIKSDFTSPNKNCTTLLLNCRGTLIKRKIKWCWTLCRGSFFLFCLQNNVASCTSTATENSLVPFKNTKEI